MNSGQYIQRKLQAWAHRKGIPLQGSEGDRGVPNYTLTVGENILGGQLLDAVAAAFEGGAGGELDGEIPTMSALHSSAALAVNLFQHWIARGDVSTLAQLLEVPSKNIVSAKFEDKFPVCDDPKSHGLKEPPHLDFALRYKNGACTGVECKLFEPFGRLDHKPLRKSYLALPNAWADIPASRALAEQLAAGTADYHRLGPSQLLKHILGLKFGAANAKVRLVYLYCDAIGDEAAEHRDEIHRFKNAIAADRICFKPISVQELILRAVRDIREDHTEYVDYLAERYL